MMEHMNQINKITKSDILDSYLAGIIDGEGSIMVRKSRYRLKGKHKDCINPSYTPRVAFKNTNEDVIKLFKKRFGGHYHKDKKLYQSKIGYRQRKLMFSYDSENQTAYKIIEKLIPYLVIKKKQAICILKLKKLKQKASQDRDKSYSNGFYGKPYKKKYINGFEKIYQEVKRCNH